MSFDVHKNLAASTVAVPPSPQTSGTTLTVTTGTGARFGAPPFPATIGPPAAAVVAFAATAEVVYVTGVTGDVLTVVRAQESTTARSVNVGDVIEAGITAKTITDIESAITALQGTISGGTP